MIAIDIFSAMKSLEGDSMHVFRYPKGMQFFIGVFSHMCITILLHAIGLIDILAGGSVLLLFGTAIVAMSMMLLRGYDKSLLYWGACFLALLVEFIVSYIATPGTTVREIIMAAQYGVQRFIYIIFSVAVLFLLFMAEFPLPEPSKPQFIDDLDDRYADDYPMLE
jgi:hypothetical protein